MLLSNAHIDTLKELVNIAMGHAAGSINELVHAHVSLGMPSIRVHLASELRKSYAEKGESRVHAITLCFTGSLSGAASLLLPPASAVKLVALTTHEEDPHILEAEKSGALSEIGNIIINALMGTLSNLLKMHLTYSVPDYQETRPADLITRMAGDAEAAILVARSRFTVEEHVIEGESMLVFELNALETLKLEISRLNAESGVLE